MRHYLAKPERLKTGKRMTSAILGTTQSSFGSLCLQPASHPSTNEVRPCLASDIRQNRAHLGWCGHRPASLRDSLGIVKNRARTFPVVEWIRICLPMQGHGFDPWSGKIPRAAEQLSPCAPKYWGPRTLKPVLLNKRSHRNEKPAHLN